MVVWLIEMVNGEKENEDLVFEEEDLTWNVVERAAGVDEPR